MTAAVVEPETTSRSSNGRDPAVLARADLVNGFSRWWLWSAMAWQDIMQRYRGSMLGPFWLTLSMGIMIGALGTLYSTLFKLQVSDYLPFLCLGLLSWTFVSGLVVDSCEVFTLKTTEMLIKQIKLPFSIYIYRMIWRNLIILAHNAVIYVVVMLVFEIAPTLATLLFIPALALVVLNAAWFALLLGMVCARFRDVPQIVASLTQVVFFVTPVIWKPELLGPREPLVHLNPFFAFVDLLRSPLLGHAPSWLSWVMAITLTILGWAVTFPLFRRFRARIPYWC